MYPWYSERFDGRQPASFAYREWAMMLARNQKFLGVGMPRRDLAVLRTDYAFANYDVQLPGAEGSFRDNYSMHDQPYYWKDLSLQAVGYGYDYFSAQLLADRENISLRDNLLQPDTVGYRAVIVYQETLELDGARGLLRVAKSGVPVLFVNGVTETINHSMPDVTHAEAASRTFSLLDDPDELRRVVESIKALPNVATVERQADVLKGSGPVRCTAPGRFRRSQSGTAQHFPLRRDGRCPQHVCLFLQVPYRQRRVVARHNSRPRRGRKALRSR